MPNPKWASTVEVEVLLAPPPAAWRELGSFGHLVLLPSDDATAVVVEVETESGEKSLRIRIEKRTNLPILDYPVFAGRTDLLKPAGGIYPLSLDERGRLRMSYREGFLAEMLFPVSRAGELLEAVNTERMSREIWDRSAADPWVIDREAILGTLLYGSMRSDRIRRRPSFDLSFDAAPGTWFGDDPFLGPFFVDSEQSSIELKGIPTGVHRFYRSHEGAFDRIDLMVREDGWLLVTTGAVGSGRW